MIQKVFFVWLATLILGCNVRQASVPTAPPRVNKVEIKSVSAEGEFTAKEKPSIFLWPVDKNGEKLSYVAHIAKRAEIIKLSDLRDEKAAEKSLIDDLCSGDNTDNCTEEMIDKAIALSNEIDNLTEEVAKAIDETYPVEKNILPVSSPIDGSSDYVILIEKGKVKEIRLPGFQKTYSLTMPSILAQTDPRFKIYDVIFRPEAQLLRFKVPWLEIPSRPKNNKNEFDDSDEEYLSKIKRLGTYIFELELTSLKSGLKRYAGQIVRLNMDGVEERVGRVQIDGQITLK